jgi:hypothetical protein
MTAFHPFQRFGSEFSIAGVDPKQKSDLQPLCARIGHFDLLRRPCHGRLTANADTLRVKYRGEVDLELRFFPRTGIQC